MSTSHSKHNNELPLYVLEDALMCILHGLFIVHEVCGHTLATYDDRDRAADAAFEREVDHQFDLVLADFYRDCVRPENC